MIDSNDTLELIRKLIDKIKGRWVESNKRPDEPEIRSILASLKGDPTQRYAYMLLAAHRETQAIEKKKLALLEKMEAAIKLSERRNAAIRHDTQERVNRAVDADNRSLRAMISRLRNLRRGGDV